MNKALVLRTIYLEAVQDEKLRELAFALKISKGELIRKLLKEGLANYDKT